MSNRGLNARLVGAMQSVALLAITAAFIEIGLQAAARWGSRFGVVRLLNTQTSPLPDPEDVWKRRFMENYRLRAATVLRLNQGEFQPDAELGWRPKENVSFVDSAGRRITTNGLGFRSTREYETDSTKYTVLVLGDSFTYGSGAGDDEVWPTILQTLEPDISVLNMAAGGYGLDQMYLMLDRHIDEFEPDLVILAFINDDINRSMLSFRDYQKPKLEIQKDELIVTNIPIGDVETVARRLMDEERSSRRPNLRLANVLARTWWLVAGERAAERRMIELNERILVETAARSAGIGAEFMLVYLPAGRSLTDPGFYPKGEQFFDEFIQRHAVHGANVRPLLLGVDMELSGGHYRYTGAAIVAEAVRTKINEIRSARVHTSLETRTVRLQPDAKMWPVSRDGGSPVPDRDRSGSGWRAGGRTFSVTP